MAYRIVDVQTACHPAQDTVAAALSTFGLSISAISDAANAFVCQAAQVPGAGYQQFVARELERFLERSLSRDGSLRSLSRAVSPVLNEKADLVIGHAPDEKGVYFEIEFRPNVEKDLVKFQIAWNRGRLAVAVLILALDRNALNASYTTMPEFGKVHRIVTELRPPYPLILVGIHGEHVTESLAGGV